MTRPENDAARAATLTWHRDHDLPPSFAAASALAAAAGLVAMWPFTSVIEPGAWSFAALAMIVVVAITGAGMRFMLRGRRPWVRDLAAAAVQTLVAIGTLTQLVVPDTAFLGIVPSESTLSVLGTLVAAAANEVTFGSAPLPATPGLHAAMGMGFAVVAILLDQLVVQRSAVLACLLTAVVGSVPMIVTLGGANVVWFVLLGILILVLLRHTAAQHPDAPRRASPALAAGIGVAALAATVLIAPVLPVSASLSGAGAGVTVDASLRLGDDLRRPNPVEVLTLSTTAGTAPYLRLTTLSQFDGRVWEPDSGDLQPQSEGFGPAEWGPDIATAEQRTSIQVVRMSSSWLPIPYATTSVQGVGSSWRVDAANRTIVSRTADADGNDYTVRSQTVRPTLEQIQSTPAAEPVVAPGATPVELPDAITEAAAEVTADATDDYSRLIALQTWFRNSFSYSLETPVEEGFDGTGVEAIVRFLDARAGYCIHFAGAFALMAESLDMQVRIVVGYLPGVRTDDETGSDAVYSVSSDQLHSWPEVLFPGIGWVPFEPTSSLGVPTSFTSETTSGGVGGDTTTPTPTTAPSAQDSTGPEIDRNDAGDNSGSSGQLRTLDPAPIMGITLAVLAALLLPALVRASLRVMRRGRARDGDAAAAWTELTSALIDLGLPVSDAHTPRMRGHALVRDRGIDAEAMSALVDAVERASYARSTAASSEDLAAPLHEVLDELRRSVSWSERLRATLLPRSLLRSRNADLSLPA